jgi:hypothetical protein
MRKQRQKRLPRRELGDGEVKRVLHQLLERSEDPSRFLELYYWCTEPELTRFVRQFLALSDSARLTLMAFVNMTADASESVRVVVGSNGEVTLSSSAVTEAMKLREISATPHQESPGSLH